jgi:hypothetical protein
MEARTTGHLSSDDTDSPIVYESPIDSILAAEEPPAGVGCVMA